MINPLPNAPVTSEYGNRTLNGISNFHIGIDLGAPNGTPSALFFLSLGTELLKA